MTDVASQRAHNAPADADVRAHAVDTSRSVIVQAPAGSGKTALLIHRYLALLAMAGKPEEVVVLTFTRKAVEELRGRVLSALRASETDAASPHERRLQALAQQVRDRDEERAWGLARTPARLSIHTIDGFCARIAGRMPWLSGLGGGLDIEAHPMRLYRDAVQSMLAHLDADDEDADALAQLLTHLDGNVATFTTLLCDMLARREQWMDLLAAGDSNAAALRQALEDALEEAAAQSLATLRQLMPDDQLSVLSAFIAAVVDSANAAADGECQDPDIRALQTLSLESPLSITHLAAWQVLARWLLTADGKSLRKAGPAPEALTAMDKAQAKEMRAHCAAMLARFATTPGLVEALQVVRGLPALTYDDAEWSLMSALFRVLKLALVALTLTFAREGRGDFVEVASASIAALGDAEAPTDLALRLDYRINHVLVDEFQDTSATHYRLVQALCAGFEQGDGRTLFLVGDPMQSIYRFRQAEVGQFLRSMRGDLAGHSLDVLRLSVNFRSQAPLVDWFNNCFKTVFPALDDAARSAVAFSPCAAIHAAASDAVTNASGVHVHPFEDDADGRQQARRTAQLVQELRTARPQDSIAVLVRARTHLPMLIEALTSRDLSYRGVDILPLSKLSVVQDLLALTRALAHPLDRVAWLSLLRAPWCGVELRDLLALVGHDLQAPIFALMSDPSLSSRLSEDARARCARVAEAIAPAMAANTVKPIKRRIEAVWYRLGAPACYPPASLGHAQAYLDLVAELDASENSLDTLDERLEELYATPDTATADVELMTMHKAKGLEFDHVILPMLERRGRADSPQLLLWSELALPAGASVAVAPRPAADGDGGRSDFVRRLESDKSRNETARLLYVACSRARRSLHMMGSVKRGSKGELKPPDPRSLLHRLWQQVEHNFVQALALPLDAATDAALDAGESLVSLATSAEGDVGLWRVPAQWRPPAPRPRRSPLPPPSPAIETALAPDDVEYDWAGRVARHAGTMVHAMLARIAVDGASAWSAERFEALRPFFHARLREFGLSAESVTEGGDRVVAALVRSITDPRGQWLLNPAHAHAESELGLSGWLDNRLVRGVLDRSFVDEQGIRWIVDYKTGDHAGSDVEQFLDREAQRYRGQLERYARLMSQLDDRPIRLGLYFPMLTGWRSWELERPA